MCVCVCAGKVDWVVARSEDSWKFQTSAMPLKVRGSQTVDQE